MKKTPPASRRFGTFLRLATGLFLLAGGSLRQTAGAMPPPPANPPTEQRWIIGSIAGDAASLALFAAGPERWAALSPDAVDVRETSGGQPGQAYALTLALPGGGEPIRSDLRITASVWSPDLYVPTLRALFARLRLAPPAATAPDTDPTPPDADLLQALTTPLTDRIEAQNQRISDRLQTHPFDARAHEQAALLLGTLALRENSGLLWNPRGLCNRAVAHLALARALRLDPSECGEVAELLVGLLIDTKADCQRRIAALQTRAASHPELAPWAAAAALRNTRDYRLLPHAQDATLLERIELFRAMSEAISDDQAIKRLANLEPSAAPDWERIVLQGGCTVESGHRFALPSLGLEMQDAAQVFPDLKGARAPGQFAAIFNVPPGGPVQAGEDGRARLRVIDRGTWAQFFQRHLLQAADQTYNFLQNKWGVHDDALQFRMQGGSLFKRLTLYPLCLDFLSKEDGEFIYAPAADLLNQHPEWVGDGAWAEVVKTVPAQHAAGGSWAAVGGAWFSPRLPVGTVYGFDRRIGSADGLPRPAPAEWQRAYEIAPLKYDVCRVYADGQAAQHRPTAKQFAQAVGPLLAYYLPAMRGEAALTLDDPAAYGEVMNRVAALNPSDYLTLARYDVQHRLEPEAARAYQAAIDQGANAVAVANDSSWLVNYYYDHGQPDRALAVARFAGEVYSFKGLETLAGLQERMGRSKEAEATYEKIHERYKDAGPLHRFYARTAGSHPEYADGMKAAESDLFPAGMEEVTLAQLSGPPSKGVQIHGENELSRAAGVRPGAIIVAFDGKRVSSTEQFTFVRELKSTPEFDLLVYQDGRYQAIHARAPGRKFGLSISTWP